MPKRKRKKEDESKKEGKKYKGVIKTKSGRFQAQIKIDGSRRSLGTFDIAKKAARAYDRAAMQARRPPTKLNYQDQVPLDYKPKKKKQDPTIRLDTEACTRQGTDSEHLSKLMAKDNSLIALAQKKRLPLHLILLPSKQNVQDLI